MLQIPARVVVVIGPGGTIAGVAARADDDAPYCAGQLPIDALLTGLALPAAIAVETESVAQIDSKDMDFATWRALACAVERQLGRAEVAGIVVTHGTDTLEETAWFLQRVVAPDRPVVLTGAMRPATAAHADGPGNLADALRVAATTSLRGVVAVLAGTVHSARDVRKAHPRRLDAFTSGGGGPLARIVEGRLERTARASQAAEAAAAAQAAEAAPAFGTGRLPAGAGAWPWVETVTSDAGADGRVVDALVGAGVAGIVVAATGNGTVHHRLDAALTAAAARGVAVVRASRCLDGAIVDGDAAATPSAGALTPVKARIELILELLAARTPR